MPHTVVRIYTDSGPLIGMLRERQREVEDIMRSVPGFVGYGIMDTGKGAVSVTTCEDKAGTDESIKRAADWIKTNLPADAKIDPPRIIQGRPVYTLRAEGVAPASGVHLAVRIFSGRPPSDFGEHATELRAALSAVPGWRSYTAILTDDGNGMLIHATDDAAYEAVLQAHRAWVQATWPGFKSEPPEAIDATGVFRFDAQAAPV